MLEIVATLLDNFITYMFLNRNTTMKFRNDIFK